MMRNNKRRSHVYSLVLLITQNAKTYFTGSMNSTTFQLNAGGRLLDLSTPVAMAIVNVTPDSFYESSRNCAEKEVLTAVEKALSEGASIIDVGAYSTRPSAKPVSEEEERERLSKPLQAIQNYFPEAIVSLDTFRSGVARWAVETCGVKIINDVSGGTLDSGMFETVADLQVPYVLMHMRGTPQIMQQLTDYENMMSEILHYFEQKTERLIRLGVKDIILDPGFGFAKTLAQNYELLAKMNYFSELGFPILCGVSRKSMIYKLIETEPAHALNGTTAVNVLGLLNGANILRVHDVKEAMEAIKIVMQYQRFL